MQGDAHWVPVVVVVVPALLLVLALAWDLTHHRR